VDNFEKGSLADTSLARQSCLGKSTSRQLIPESNMKVRRFHASILFL